ncbi:MAG TPA: serine/threonine-protein kinase [Gemmatimonadaceae bacterium]|nr:serine/threonine-protein kinase [Gemmatimonadaceae bacterium]
MSDPVVPSSDSELRTHVERVLSPHYELDQEIGRGGMGVVYRAKDRRLKRTVAIKVLPPELAFRSEIKTRFLREAETAAQLNHPNIVDIYAVDEAEGIVYFVMAYITGDNLAKRLHDQGALSCDETRRILRDVADALAYAHERGVVHRDIKPDNILIDAQSGRPMVTDFGIARAVSEGDTRLTATGIAIGTPTYMSPEQAAGERTIDGRSDLYSLGVVGYQMLTGEPPFIANSTPAILVKHISEQPTPIEQRRSDVPQDLARSIMMLLEKDPANRFPSASAVVVALDTGRAPSNAASPRTSAATPASAAYPVPAPGQGAAPYGGATSPELYAQRPPTPEEWRRWEAPQVVAFRRKLAPYLFVNGVIVIASIVGDSDFFGITVIWSIYLAFKYAKLWADGYDWRDVFRQPRDRDLIDVAEDALSYVRAIFNRNERRAMREARRARRVSSGGAQPTVPRLGAGDDVLRAAGPYAERVRRAEADRDEIIRLLDRMPSSERQRIPDVGRSADALAEKVRSLAVAMADLEASAGAGGLSAIETEISKLESAANPLDRAASEERVRRLAYLKRQRRALADVGTKRDAIAAKLDTCVVALQNMKLDLIRLNAGSQTPQHITSLAMDALNLADSVDSALYVADEMNRNTGTRPASRPAAR